ncbi:MAG: hypothetical protein ACE5I8_12920, partial [Thermodesulfobacteriota bacterium]
FHPRILDERADELAVESHSDQEMAKAGGKVPPFSLERGTVRVCSFFPFWGNYEKKLESSGMVRGGSRL